MPPLVTVLPPSAPVLAPASDSGVKGDDVTNVAAPTLTGTGTAGDTVLLLDGTVPVGTAVVASDGTWSTVSSTLADGLHTLTATESDGSGHVSDPSPALALTIDTAAPPPPSNLALDPGSDTGVKGDDHTTVASPVITGTAEPGTTVQLADGGAPIGTATADPATGAWSITPTSPLQQGPNGLTATSTDAAGNSSSGGFTVTLDPAASTGSAAALPAPFDPRFDLVDSATLASQLLRGSDYSGPVDHLQAAYDHSATNPSVISALVGNVFIHADVGENAEAAKGGNNVLAGGAGSSWLVGADGSDGGTDTFFISPHDGQQAWDTLVNFHVGDMLTLWDFNSAAGSISSMGTMGADGGQGETKSIDFGLGAGANTLVTFAGLDSSAQFTTSAGTSGGLDYTMLTRTA